jgi:hypothetical protein
VALPPGRGLYNADVNRDAADMTDYDAANRLLGERQDIGAGAKTAGYSYTSDSLADIVAYPAGCGCSSGVNRDLDCL